MIDLLHWHRLNPENRIPTGRHVVAEQKDFSSVHSHKSLLLPLSWENLRLLTPTEIRGRGGQRQHTVTLDSQQWPHTHTHIVMLWPLVTRPSTPLPSCGPPLMDCFPHSWCLACAVASQDSRRPLGTALFSLSLTLNLQTVSSFTH